MIIEDSDPIIDIEQTALSKEEKMQVTKIQETFAHKGLLENL